jgi:hypothetical protein
MTPQPTCFVTASSALANPPIKNQESRRDGAKCGHPEYVLSREPWTATSVDIKPLLLPPHTRGSLRAPLGSADNGHGWRKFSPFFAGTWGPIVRAGCGDSLGSRWARQGVACGGGLRYTLRALSAQVLPTLAGVIETEWIANMDTLQLCEVGLSPCRSNCRVAPGTD